jgi:flagellar M-ring protein FliF
MAGRSGGVNGLLEGLKALGPARLVAMAAVAAGMLGLLAVLALHGGNERMALLYADLDMRETGQMAEQLDRQHIPHQIGAGGSEILVPASDVAQARLLLAREGLPSGGSIGYEIFDRGDGLVANQFQQSINQARALEGELSRTIRTITGVRGARVHLVLPRREPFQRTQQDAQASVLITTAGNGRIDHEGVQAILTLVAAAVPGLRPQSISIIDNHGNLLARAGEPLGEAAAAASGEELRRATEGRLSRAVEEMLERSLGPGRVRAEAAVEMDFDQVHETQEKYDPEGQVARSTQSVTDNNKSTEATPATTVQNNLPNADAGAAASGSQDARQEETTNYEIGKTVRTLVREHPQIRRISLAVMVDGADEKNDKGEAQWRERTPEELQRIAALVHGAIGYDEKRGDHVEVVNMRFAHEDQMVEPPAFLGLKLDKPDVMRLAQTGLVGVLGILALLLVLRPMMLRLTNLPGIEAPLADLALAGAMAAGGADQAMLADAAGAPGVPRLSGPASAGGRGPAADEKDAMVSLASVEGQLRASSIRRIAELVEKHPEQSLSIVRGWIQQEAA